VLFTLGTSLSLGTRQEAARAARDRPESIGGWGEALVAVGVKGSRRTEMGYEAGCAHETGCEAG
jgi:hypothetical protein